MEDHSVDVLGVGPQEIGDFLHSLGDDMVKESAEISDQSYVQIISIKE